MAGAQAPDGPSLAAMPPAPAPAQVSPKTVWVVALNLLAVAAILYVLRSTWMFVSWILIALFIAVALNAPVRLLQRRGLPRGAGVAVVFLGVVGFLTLLFVTLAPLLVEQGRNLVNAAPGLVQSLQQHAWFQWADQRFELAQKLQALVSERAAGIAHPLLGVVVAVFSGLFGLVTVLTLSVFMLLFGPDLIHKALLWLEPDLRNRYRVLVRQIEATVGGYVLGAMVISLLGGVSVALAMLATGVPWFLPIGLAVGILGMIPFIGSAVGMILMVGTALTTTGLKAAVICVLAYEVFLNLKNKLIAPLIQRHTLKMNPLLIAVVLLLGTGLGGIVGAVLALPVAGVAQVVLRDALRRRQRQWARPQVAHAVRQRDWIEELPPDEQPEHGLRH